ncbi:hypothetical protein UlMin_015604 [Ulmus minor]
MKGVMRFGRKGKLSPRFIGPFEILKRVGKVAYQLALPPSLSAVHNVFHVSMLKKYISDPSHVLQEAPVEIDEKLSYEERPVRILDRKAKELRNKTIALVKKMRCVRSSQICFDFRGRKFSNRGGICNHCYSIAK